MSPAQGDTCWAPFATWVLKGMFSINDALEADSDGRVAPHSGPLSRADVQEHRVGPAAGHLCARVQVPQLRRDVLDLLSGDGQHDEVRRAFGASVSITVLRCNVRKTMRRIAASVSDGTTGPIPAADLMYLRDDVQQVLAGESTSQRSDHGTDTQTARASPPCHDGALCCTPATTATMGVDSHRSR